MSVQETLSTTVRNRSFISEAMRRPMLTAERELELARRWRGEGDERALHELVSAYVRLVIATAVRFRGYGLPMADLMQEGNVGLMQAAARFEPERNVRFSTYASWWIRSAMQEYVLRNWSIVRAGTSASQKALFFNLRWLRAKIEKDGAAQISEVAKRKIARQLKVSPSEVEAMSQRLSTRDQSLNERIGEDGGDELENFLADPSPTPEELLVQHNEGAVRARWLGAALSELSAREQLIVRERMLRDDKVTLEELGGTLGITKERVRQIEHKAFEKLRAAVLRRSREAEVVGIAA